MGKTIINKESTLEPALISSIMSLFAMRCVLPSVPSALDILNTSGIFYYTGLQLFQHGIREGALGQKRLKCATG